LLLITLLLLLWLLLLLLYVCRPAPIIGDEDDLLNNLLFQVRCRQGAAQFC
jgi:hypothetical protein